MAHFNPRSLHGERPAKVSCGRSSSSFQSTLPARGATAFFCHVVPALMISIHAPCTGSDRLHAFSGLTNLIFQSTLPARGATAAAFGNADYGISIHAPCTGSDGKSGNAIPRIHISIHAPCTGSDCPAPCNHMALDNFNPRSLHGERLTNMSNKIEKTHISIHAPCTGSDCGIPRNSWFILISIHAPCTGSDGSTMSDTPSTLPFQSTLPARGATI